MTNNIIYPSSNDDNYDFDNLLIMSGIGFSHNGDNSVYDSSLFSPAEVGEDKKNEDLSN